MTRAITILVSANRRLAQRLWRESLDSLLLLQLKHLSEDYQLSLSRGELKLLNQHWYVTHVGLLRVARRARCVGISVQVVSRLSNPSTSRFSFKATVYTSKVCRGFTGYGDADPSNVSPLVRGAEMRVAETRAVNRALRKAYGIGICSVEELGFVDRAVSRERPVRKLPPVSSNGNNGHGGNGNGSRIRDRLCQLIR